MIRMQYNLFLNKMKYMKKKLKIYIDSPIPKPMDIKKFDISIKKEVTDREKT